MKAQVHPVAVVAAAIVLMLAACGGEEDGADGAGDGGSSLPASTERAQSGGAATVPTTIPDVWGLSDECEGIANVMLGVIQAFSGAVENADVLFAAGVDSLPGELEADVAILQRAVSEFAEALDDIGVNPFTDPNALTNMTPEQLDEFEQLTQLFNSVEIDRAFENVERYGERECDEFNIGG